MKELQDVQERQDAEKREKYETVRAQREAMMGRAAKRLIEITSGHLLGFGVPPRMYLQLDRTTSPM